MNGDGSMRKAQATFVGSCQKKKTDEERLGTVSGTTASYTVAEKVYTGRTA
jgi:hypothetical protein